MWELGTFFGLLLLGFVVGKILEHRHLASLRGREQAARDVVVSNLKTPPAGRPVREAFLCSGSVVISSDYYKSFGAALKSLIGGRLRTFETLLERGRREAVLRMVEKGKGRGAHMIINTRLETSTISRGQGKGGMAGAEVVAYGTGLTFQDG